MDYSCADDLDGVDAGRGRMAVESPTLPLNYCFDVPRTIRRGGEFEFEFDW